MISSRSAVMYANAVQPIIFAMIAATDLTLRVQGTLITTKRDGESGDWPFTAEQSFSERK